MTTGTTTSGDVAREKTDEKAGHAGPGNDVHTPDTPTEGGTNSTAGADGVDQGDNRGNNDQAAKTMAGGENASRTIMQDEQRQEGTGPAHIAQQQQDAGTDLGALTGTIGGAIGAKPEIPDNAGLDRMDDAELAALARAHDLRASDRASAISLLKKHRQAQHPGGGDARGAAVSDQSLPAAAHASSVNGSTHDQLTDGKSLAESAVAAGDREHQAKLVQAKAFSSSDPGRPAALHDRVEFIHPAHRADHNVPLPAVVTAINPTGTLELMVQPVGAEEFPATNISGQESEGAYWRWPAKG